MGFKLNLYSSIVFFIFGAYITACTSVCFAQTKEILVVGDVSGSMRGFASKSPKKLETIYRILIRNTATLSANTQLSKTPGDGTKLVEELAPDKLSTFTKTKTYTGQITPLGEVISQKSTDYSSLFLLTDGIQSDNLYLRLQESLIQLTEQDWGIWIMLIPVEFDGKLDVEQPIIADHHLPQINQCIQAEDPMWKVILNPHANRTINFTGSRGLLLFVLDKDIKRGRRIAEVISTDLKAELMQPNIVEASPLQLREYTLRQTELKSLGVSVKDENTVNHLIVADPDNGDIDKKLLLRLDWKNPPPTFPQPFREVWNLTKETQPDWSGLSIIKSNDIQQSPGDLSLNVNSDRTWIEWIWSIFSSEPSKRSDILHFKISSFLEPNDLGWWRQWDSDTTWRCPQKVFKLKSLVDTISEASQKRRMVSPAEEHHKLELQIGIK